MDQSGKLKREINPRENASFISIITFFFTYKFFKKGFKRDLRESDIYEILNDFRAKQLGDKIEKTWEEEKLKKFPSLIKVIFRCFGKRYLTYGIMQLIMKSILINLSPMAMGKLVSYFTPGQTEVTKSQACMYAVITIGINTIYFVYAHTYSLLLAQMGLQIRAGFSSLLYRKAMRLSPKALSEVSTGKIITLMTQDTNSFETATYFLNDLWIAVVQASVIAFVMYYQMGIAGIIGLLVFLLTIPIHLYTGRWIGKFKIRSSCRTDERLKATQEVLTSIKIIKMFTWERFFSKKVSEFRKSEIKMLRRIFCLEAFTLALGLLSSKISFYVCVMSYLYFGNNITAEKAFVVLGCYQILRSTLTINIPLGVIFLAEFNSAKKRFTKVLLSEEITSKEEIEEYKIKTPKITVNKLSVIDQQTKVLQGLNFEINAGLTTIAGYVGSGKSAVLRLFLNDLSATEGSVTIEGRISYASQEPWLFPGTIKQNILFGQPYNPERYKKVLQVCCLNKDLQLLPFKDSTIAGDKGLNLSRGQQARINLARAVYKDCEIYLLDDVFSALDAGVSKEVFRECIRKFLKDKICVLVTHNSQHMKEADKIIVMSQGSVVCSGSYKELEEKGLSYNIFDLEEKDVTHIEEVVVESQQNEDEESRLLEKGVSVFSENKKEGKVDLKMYKKYFSFGGNPLICLSLFFLFIIAQITVSYSDVLVSNWVDIEQQITTYKTNFTAAEAYRNVTEKRTFTLNVYNVMIILATILTVGRAIAFFLFTSVVSMRLHKNVFQSILNAPMLFFDTHLMGNILNRFSRDILIIDDSIPFRVFEMIRVSLYLIGIIYVICSVNYIFLIPSAILILVLYWIRRFYLPVGRSLMRLEGTTRSPVIGHLSASLEGISTIRACKAEGILQSEFDTHLDIFHSSCYMYATASRAFGFLMDVLSLLYITTLTTVFLTVDTGILAGKVGLALTQAFSLTGFLQWGIRQWAELENRMTSMERVLEYSDVKGEDKSGENPENWPLYGKIEYKNVFLTYDGCKSPIFNNLSFKVDAKQKIGIVGRTGAGKSSIISTLFKLYEVEGTITIDNLDIKKISTETLRSKISIIPQSPILFNGTIRDNLDPYKQLPDETIWKALDDVRLKPLITSLEDKIVEGGCGFSAGQRQLICLARAILKNNKILVLDEATANIDPQTDVFIQQTIKKIFHDCTVLTIAHRLDTVLHSDKVMVIHEGRLIEFDAPEVLLKNKDGAFCKMVQQAGLVKEHKE